MAKETRSSGRSKPPIRDMDRDANRVAIIMRRIHAVEPRWSRALESVCSVPTLGDASIALGINRSTLYLDYLSGLAAFQVEMVRDGLD